MLKNEVLGRISVHRWLVLSLCNCERMSSLHIGLSLGSFDRGQIGGLCRNCLLILTLLNLLLLLVYLFIFLINWRYDLLCEIHVIKEAFVIHGSVIRRFQNIWFLLP